jgi:hypothetical protein
MNQRFLKAVARDEAASGGSGSQREGQTLLFHGRTTIGSRRGLFGLADQIDPAFAKLAIELQRWGTRFRL